MTWHLVTRVALVLMQHCTMSASLEHFCTPSALALRAPALRVWEVTKCCEPQILEGSAGRSAMSRRWVGITKVGQAQNLAPTGCSLESSYCYGSCGSQNKFRQPQ